MINIDDRILSEVDESQLFLLCAIAKHMGDNSKAWPSNKTLCKTTRWSESKLLRVKKSAIDAGLLGAESRYKDNAQTSNLYQIKTRRIGVMVNLADMPPTSTDEAPPHSEMNTPTPSEMNTPPLQEWRAEVLTNEVLTNMNYKADKPQPTPQNEDQPNQHINENPKKEKKFNGGGAAKNSDGGQILEVVNFLNDTVKPACNFRTASKTTASHIRQRIAEGFTVSDICIVIEHKNSQWKNDAKMSEYLRPATLFGTGKFEGYLIAARTWEKSGKINAANFVGNQTQRSGLNGFGSDPAKYQEKALF